MQQLTCNIDLSCSFYYPLFSFVLLELKPFGFKGKSPGGKIMKKCEKSVKNSETILPFSCDTTIYDSFVAVPFCISPTKKLPRTLHGCPKDRARLS